ncbi:hypothetical protein FOXG_20361 [Fusarium oxysporum f. sp. lycopersici 4287]|uniref:Uncharacterized protein n=2 Tax=Fusarium oxysporum TaxID=5507 RepID=A0A0J9VH44_FUSO4|nr:hypothetical protein FOXG_20361 [Fusarium oxysporum f. sp. lycopersici 4287]EXK40790.1 hypothetical protein FOMG_07531 [Fusarium oxysporum f. sp. melonis 26406]KNB10569.1 hypothetical protein FOXG_20361 [Fusarium oxysporum f. sp. lycopersici 4287]
MTSMEAAEKTLISWSFRDDTYVGAIGAEKKVGLEEGLEQSEGRGGIGFMCQS